MAITYATPPPQNLEVLVRDVLPLHLASDELLGLTHQVFDIDADTLRTGGGLEAATPTAWRYVTRSAAGEHRIVEIGTDADSGEPRLRCINTGDHVENLVALHDDGPLPVVEHDHELRVLRSPECQILALWLTRDGDGAQFLVPLAPAHGNVVPDVAYPAEAFTTILQDTAREMAGGSPRPAVADRAAAEAADEDDLTRVEGIGPQIARLLAEHGITTFSALADSTGDALTAILRRAGSRFNRAEPDTWPEQATLARHERWAELADLQRRLTGGR